MSHKLNQWQMLLLTISFLVGSSLLLAPNLTSFYSKQDAWLSMIIALAAGLILNWLWIYLLSKYQYQSIFVIAEKAVGKWIGGLISLLVVFYALHLCSYVVRNVSNFMISSVLPDTNAWTFQMMLIIVSLYSCYYGLNNIARVNEFLNPIMGVLFLVSLLLTLNRFELHNLKPFWSNHLGVSFRELIQQRDFLLLRSSCWGPCLHMYQKEKSYENVFNGYRDFRLNSFDNDHYRNRC